MAVSLSRRLASLLAGAGVVLATALTTSPAIADSAPADPATPATVAADALPTVQVDGVVWSQVVVGRTVYAAGQFTTARPAGSAPGVNTVARHNLLAYDIETGRLVTGFAPRLNGQALSVTRSPDGSRIYVVGDFTQVDGQWRVRAAAFDTATGQLVSSFRPTLASRGLTVAATDDTVYIGGNFTSAASVTGGTLVPRSYLAAFAAGNGQLKPFQADADQPVTALAVTADRSKVVVGGRFTTLAGSPAIGLAAVNPTSGARLSFPASQYIRNSGTRSSITSLYADASGVYGTGYHMSKSGNLEGSFRAHASTGELIWVADCHGDAYSVFPQGDVVYTSSHHHYCGNVPGGFPQEEPWEFFHANAFTKAPTGVNTKDIYGYPHHAGEPAPTQLYFYPQFYTGTFTGQGQATWSVSGNDRYVVMGGEFPGVNGQPQQGLVRFARPDIAPNDQGPRLSGAELNPRVSSFAAGTVRVSWPVSWDRDNMTLTYRVYRAGQTAPIHQRTVTAPFWDGPTTGFTDTGLPAGSTQRYRVTASDPFGNVAQSQEVSVTVSGTGAVHPYVATVFRDEPTAYWRLGEPSGSTVRDWAGFDDATAAAGVSRGVTGAVADDAATSFNGTTSGYAASSDVDHARDTFSVETWVRTTTTAGGKLVGFGRSATGTSSSGFDRHIYMDDAGRLFFGVYPGTARTINSPASYNDGKWHHVVATLGSNGMQLFVDGVRVAQRTDTTSGQPAVYGYWRIGGDNLSGWPSRPSSNYLAGSLDEVAVYPRVLSAATIAEHHARATSTTPVPAPANQPPAAAFTLSVSGLTVSVDGSGSSDPDGSVTAHAWDFGDGRTGSGARASHTYAAAGTYPVRLTVTDSAGATASTTRQAVVTAPAPAPEPTTDLARDAFGRELASGWGAAEVGGTWAVSGTASRYAVSGGAGLHRVPTAGTTLSAYLTGVSSTATDLQVTVGADKPQTGGGTYVSVVGRRVGSATYSGRLRFLSTGAVTLSAMNGGTALQSVNVPGLVYVPGERLHVRVRVAGTAPTTVQAKVWPVGAVEPTLWQVSVTDPTAALQAAGHIGMVTYLSGSATNAPMTVAYDDLRAAPAG